MRLKQYTDSNEIIRKYSLKSHPEGGHAQLLYEDQQIIKEQYLPPGYQGDRSFWNGIYYLLSKDERSIFHRIRMSELWNFYLGCPLELYDISPEGQFKKVILGDDILQGHELAYVFPKGHWIGAMPLHNQSYDFSFVSCITSPGFTFSDWEKGDRGVLIDLYPHLQEAIIKLTD